MSYSEQTTATLCVNDNEDYLNTRDLKEDKRTMSSIECLGYSIFSDEHLPDLSYSGKTVINTINPHCYIVAKKDQLYQKALKRSTILIPDGTGIVWAMKVLNKQQVKRFSGSLLHLQLLKRMNETSGKIFYLGSSDMTLQ